MGSWVAHVIHLASAQHVVQSAQMLLTCEEHRLLRHEADLGVQVLVVDRIQWCACD